MEQKQRLDGLDLLRSLAIFFVLVTHMLNYTGLLNVRLRSVPWIVYDFVHYISMLCVPLFLLLTGFLQEKRDLNSRHYRALLPLLLSYFIIYGAGALFMPSEQNPFALVLSVFSGNFGYGWYVGMYVLLSLLIPFLNKMLHSLTRKQHLFLLAVLSAVSMLPALLSGFSIGGVQLKLLPDFFENAYVIAFYCTGAYIARFQPEIKPLRCFSGFALVITAEAFVCYLLSGNRYAWEPFNKNAAITHMLAAVCLFLALYKIQFKTKLFCAVCREISLCSFEMYLLSYFTDYLLFTYLTISPLEIVCLNFVLLYALAKAVRFILSPIVKRLKRTRSEIRPVGF